MNDDRKKIGLAIVGCGKLVGQLSSGSTGSSGVPSPGLEGVPKEIELGSENLTFIRYSAKEDNGRIPIINTKNSLLVIMFYGGYCTNIIMLLY